ncbi:MAG: energy transducer TonB [Bacteroidetes bacterium]|nr:energy transducer TonB [Bacteroidota bacterium]
MSFRMLFYAFLALVSFGLLVSLCSSCHKQAASVLPENEVATQADFKGGASAWLSFLNKNIRYPDEAVNEEIMGTVPVKFVIETDGKVTDVQALEGHALLQKEAIRAIQLSSGQWKPGEVDGHPVRSFKTQPIVFRLEAQ